MAGQCCESLSQALRLCQPAITKEEEEPGLRLMPAGELCPAGGKGGRTRAGTAGSGGSSGV